jgi:hypothetical protein
MPTDDLWPATQAQSGITTEYKRVSFQLFSFSASSAVRLQALWELWGSLVDALGWLCRRFRVALGSQSVGYQQALGSH